MNIKKIKKTFWAPAALPALFFASCSEDDPTADEPGRGGNENGGDVRFEISIPPVRRNEA